MVQPWNSGLGVFKLNYFTHSVAVSWEFLSVYNKTSV